MVRDMQVKMNRRRDSAWLPFLCSYTVKHWIGGFFRFLRIPILVDALSAQSSAVVASDCVKQYDSSDCWARQTTLQKKLDGLYLLEEKAVLQNLKDYEPEVQKQTIKSLRQTNAAFGRFKDAECSSDPLVDGMSLRDSGVMSDSCKVEWREKRIEELSVRLKKFSTSK